MTLAAWGPLGPCSTVNSTFWPSTSLREPFALDRRVVDKYVRTTIPRDEAVALLRIEPLDGSDDTFGHCIASFWQQKKEICSDVARPSVRQNEMTRLKALGSPDFGSKR